MQIICISRGTFGGGVELAQKLASKLAYDCMGREEVTDAATRAGIAVGKLEMSVVKRRPLTEQLAAEKARYAAFITATLCERMQKRGIVYHGRTGHMVLPGVTNTLRVRAITDIEDRTRRAMGRLALEHAKARKYIEQVDEDRHRWVRTLYGLDWDDPKHYDTVINLSRLAVDNAASALLAMTQLPEFQPTPASSKALADLWLAARCRLAIGMNHYAPEADVQVRTDGGHVAVTYLPRDAGVAGMIPEILGQVEGVESIRCTMATTNILWVQERYDPGKPALAQLLDVAERWGAAIELARLRPEPAEAATPSAEGEAAGDGEAPGDDDAPQSADAAPPEHGGILEDSGEDDVQGDDGGVEDTLDHLIQGGRAGGSWEVAGGMQNLVDRLDPTTPYSLAVVGDVFLSRADSVRKRMTRELVSHLSDNMKVPVIGLDQLETQFQFGPKQWMKLVGALAITIAVVFAVFTHQAEIQTFLVRPGVTNRIIAVAAIAAFVPVFASIYGAFGQYLMRLFKFE